jgi:cysteine desulfurase / selenocysteine lyase
VTQTVDLQAFRSEFPVTNEWSYLNHAAYGPFPRRTVDAVKEWAEGFAWAPAFFGPEREQVPAETAELVAKLAGGRADMVAWVGSLADGMNLLANGIDTQPGDNIVMPVDEFPSVVYPFLNLTTRGVELRWAPKNAEGRTDAGIIAAHMDERTRAVALSHVEYMDGFRNDLQELGQLCQSRGAELFVDVTQSLGAQPINIEGSGVSAVVAHGYKWLMSGFGIGVVVFNSQAIDRIRVTYAGRLSVKHGFEETEYRLDWREGAGRFQTGGLNQLGLSAMRASLSLVTEAGPEWTAEHCTRLNDRLAEGLTGMGYTFVSEMDPRHRSQITAFTSGSRERDAEIVQELERANVAVTLRGKGVRVSPYFYNTEADIDRLLEALRPM